MAGLLDVNALVALAWDSHIHHRATIRWFKRHAHRGWCTCPVTESGFVRVSSNPVVLPSAITVAEATDVLRAVRRLPGHRFIGDDVSAADADVQYVSGYRQVTDAHLLTLARRNDVDLVTFDRGASSLAGGQGLTLLERDEQ